MQCETRLEQTVVNTWGILVMRHQNFIYTTILKSKVRRPVKIDRSITLMTVVGNLPPLMRPSRDP